VWESLGALDLAPTSPKYGAPRLFVHGRQDPIPIASSERSQRPMNATLVPLDDCGHVPYVEQPEKLFAALTESFLR